MSMDGFTKAYQLVRRVVAPTELLLDPTNPRLVTDSSQYREYTSAELASPQIQAHVLEMVSRKEHGVRQLIESISQMGFIGGLHEMIVKRVGKRGGYLVLEGNRRTAALKYLLQHEEQLRAEVKLSIQEIAVQEFVYCPNDEHAEEEVIDILLGTIHIDGPKEWGALEKAHYIHRSYVRELRSGEPFRYVPEAAKRVGEKFKLSGRAVKHLLTVCRVYEQMKHADLAVHPRHYSLIDLAAKTRAVSHDYFELDDESCEFSEQGVERFASLCLTDPAPIHNPKLFQAFAFVYVEGTDLERAQILAGEREIDDVAYAVRERKKRRAFREDLERIRDLLGDLHISEFNGTGAERDEIRRICRFVNNTLAPLLAVD